MSLCSVPSVRLVPNFNPSSQTWVNQYVMLSHQCPFGGFKQSGWGRELGVEVSYLPLRTPGDRKLTACRHLAGSRGIPDDQDGTLLLRRGFRVADCAVELFHAIVHSSSIHRVGSRDVVKRGCRFDPHE